MDIIPTEVLRIIDVNLNRVSEGLRVLEDIARLALNDPSLSQQLKNMRHQLVETNQSFQQQLIQARDAEYDIGQNMVAPGQEKPKELSVVVIANARRVQQSLRTIEELAKTKPLASKMDAERFKQSRFELYSIERGLLSRLFRRDKLENIRGLYAIIDTQALRGRNYIEVARQLIDGGTRIIQLRDKISTKPELLVIAQQLKGLCSKHQVLFIVNDYLDLALASDADGLHLGQHDLPIRVARRLLPIDKLIGSSTNTVDQAIAAAASGADYIAVGAMYTTTSKEKPIIVGPDRLRQIRQAVALPLVAIGGITKDNAVEVINAGANSVAVISSLLQAESPQAAARQIVSQIEALDEPIN
ncbi:MAG: thiamine phosphate synthase [Dehalococcoidales bacterium]|nr:thiamine phosphate synthase [Dehalococcoidales bacterium]